jgi:hypothetical protein
LSAAVGIAYRYACPSNQSKIATIGEYQEIQLAKPNYKHAKKQKEAARKARQDAKQQRRATGPDGSVTGDLPESSELPEAPVEAVPVKAEA